MFTIISMPISGYTLAGIYSLAYCFLARRAKFTWKQNVVILPSGFLVGKLVEWIYKMGVNSAFTGYFAAFCYFATLARLYWLLGDRWRNERIRDSTDECSLGVFMGSGGHTAEMKALVSSLDFDRYTPRTYVYCHGDEISMRVISELEATSTVTHKLLALPRARKVGESRISTLFSASKTLIVAFWYTFLIPLFRNPMTPWVDALLLNGPGTAVVLVAVAWIRRFFGIPWTKIIYVESFARTNSLSLSGKILRGLVDVFVIQWPEAAGPGATISRQERNIPGSDGTKVTHRGWLV